MLTTTTKTLIALMAFLSVFSVLQTELWEKDVTSEINIGLSTTGYKSVDLRCDAEHFTVNVTLEKDFQGMVYARGTFGEKKSPCFKRHSQTLFKGEDAVTIGLRIPFNKCRTVMDVAESCYTNTLVVQHDPELIMPGDAAFSLSCAFTPEFPVSTSVSAETRFKSKIRLVSADPAGKSDAKNEKFTASSDTANVKFSPEEGRSRGKVTDEL